MFKVLGVSLIALAIALAVVPMFTDCQSQGKAIELPNGRTVPMKCHWSGVAEIATAVPMVAVGAMMAGSKRRSSIRGLGVLGITLGALAILLPTYMIGTCSSAMLCNTVMKPTLVTLGSLVVVGSVGAMVLSGRAKA